MAKALGDPHRGRDYVTRYMGGLDIQVIAIQEEEATEKSKYNKRRAKYLQK